MTKSSEALLGSKNRFSFWKAKYSTKKFGRADYAGDVKTRKSNIFKNDGTPVSQFFKDKDS